MKINPKKGIMALFLAASFIFICAFSLFFTNGAYLAGEGAVSNSKVPPKELFNKTWAIVRANYWDINLNRQNWQRWKTRYKNVIKTEEDALVAINSMLASLNDPYSRFLDKEEFKEQNEIIDSKIYGIGVNIALINGKITIVNVMKDTPAALNGLRAGDIISKINDNNLKGVPLDEAVNIIKSTPGQIKLEIIRAKKDGTESQKLTKNIERAEIKIKTIESSVLEDKIGYIKISSFISTGAPLEFMDALSGVRNTEGLILDLRGNGGGLLGNAVFVADMFLNKGSIVQIVGRKGVLGSYWAEEKDYSYDKPLVVLVDEDSASASEIVSAALQDNARALVVGTKTFGKGVVQRVYAMPNSLGLNLTVAKYLTPNGNDINKKGVEPNYFVEITKSDLAKNSDSQLDFAKNILKSKILSAKPAGK